MKIKARANAAQGCLWEEYEKTDISSTAERYLGKAGRILHSHRRIKHPATIFNASVFNAKGFRIWHGDLDIQQSRKGLVHLFLNVGALYVHNEIGDTRSMSLDEIRSSAAVTLGRGQIFYNKEFTERMRELQDHMSLRRKFKKRK